MILSDRDIRKYIREGEIKIEPEPDFGESLGSCSIDLRLGYASQNPKSEIRNPKINVKSQKLILKPGGFALGTTLEYVELPDNLCGMLHGRSSLGRKGLMIHSTAPLVDAGFRGKIVLELFNSGSKEIELTIGERVCALSFEKLSSPAEVPYYKKSGAKFAGQDEKIL